MTVNDQGLLARVTHCTTVACLLKRGRSFVRFRLSYSVRSAVIGFTRVARLAGKKQARSAAVASIKLALTSANGSVGLTSYKILARTRPAASERRRPQP